MLLRGHKERFELDIAKLEQPSQVPVLILILIKHCKLVGTSLHHCGNVARYIALDRPITRHKHLCAEANTVHQIYAFDFKLVLEFFA